MEYAERRARFRKFFDPEGDRLVYVGAAADSDFWDRRWLEAGSAAYPAAAPRRHLVVRETLRLLAPGSLVLEGGCGPATASWYLHRLGYRTLALDYARATLARVVHRVPAVRPLAGDVFALPLAAGSVDGYWSLGVVEHFYDGWDAIRDEMRRVIRPGGFLFLTFPAMSSLRRCKSRLGLYPRWPPAPDTPPFYQFALPAERVAERLAASGFERVRSVAWLGVTGLCEELGAAGRRLDRALSSRRRAVRVARALLDRLVRPLAYHVRLLVCRRC